jgi:ADP-ribose pyrophosphatase YjhB (NUDIX family)
VKPGQIRPLALGIFWRGDELLVSVGHDPVKGERFYRPLGGGILFGERGRDALAREIREEIDAGIEDARFLGSLENLFTYAGQQGHEIILLYEARFVDASLYESHRLTGQDDDGQFDALWMPLTSFGSGESPLYPDGLVELLLRWRGSGASG